MDTWNTILKKRTNVLEQAVFVLETLAHPEHIPILEYLTEHEDATLLDLAIDTRSDVTFIEEQLESLIQTGVVCVDANIYGNKYRINGRRIVNINAIVRQLVNGK